ncbi:bifunctional diguanylate cyclase/phosphodiesterase [Alteromonas sp. KS69]|uniref:sensor domain-containing phosphodiesterase n=1 Tax=unclassified Alteromonas TaxID=2614992 RepID=UPI000C0F730B|nr:MULTISPECIES: EAL domain-containing protein [unclassified Alteromonas]MBO7921862.1 EAL domain-containing protein [Alteromonas sp. K632G]PHS56013.1 MAG: bifunctional diguanylate cyclase/phosphodiesterase [Alteromonas sp.]RUP80851.1 bifunctional diguanylate cyclase/phosphodiesterase [Alteromonas sp. KS69]|tara:strand:- start:39719 stop:42319 length:2601 start_codon:yes stop_codon:yes gene_type:complete
MSSDSTQYELTEEELREIIPQLQQLTNKYKRAERVQKALFDISELASSVSHLNRLYTAIHEIIADFMNADNFFVAFYEQDSQIVDFAYFVDEFDEQTVKQLPADSLMDGMTGFILRTGQHLFYKRAQEEIFAEDHGIKLVGSQPFELLGVPLKRGSQVIGAMVVQTYDEGVHYTQEDLEVLLFVSQHIVTTVDRVKNRELTERTIRERTRQLRKINDDLQEEILERQKVESLQQALFEISELAANLEGDMSVFYSSLHEILARLISAPNCFISIIDESKQMLEFPYFSDMESEDVEARPMGLGLTEFVLRTGQAELINPPRVLELAEAGEIDVTIAQTMLNSANSWLGSPLVVDGEVFGVIAVQTYGKHAKYNARDLELLRFVSHHIAVTMERKRSTEEIQRHNSELELRVAARTAELDRANKYLKQQIEERKEIELKLIHDAHHDSLTDLPNRSMFTSRLELAVASKQRYTENYFAVLFIDLDRFKVINDTLGHHAGDEFLVEVARRIALCIRGHDLLARLGGDEFVVLLDNFEDLTDVQEVASRIINSISEPFLLDGREMYSGASIGIANLESYYRSADEVLRDADAAMYQAKTLGRGRFVMFDKSMRDRLIEELELENEFRRALRDEEFEYFLQPVIDLRDNTTLYNEMYVRWCHPTFGKIAREQFRQVAEQSGLTLDLDLFQLRKACELLAHAKATGEDKGRIAVNVSIIHLLQASMVNKMISLIDEYKISPHDLVFEFDENDLNRRSQFILPAIKKLKRAGVTLVLDNFGSGLASLSYLFAYPFEFIKIDHRFVRSLPRSQRNLKLIQSVMLISEHLKFKVIAEGVDAPAQLNALTDIECNYAQGKVLTRATVLDMKQLAG